MPNYKLPTDLKEFLNSQVRRLSDRSVSYALHNCPLTIDQVQDSCVELDASTLITLRTLKERGVPMSTRDNVTVGFEHEQLPGLRRSVALYLDLPKYIYTGKSTSGSNINWNAPKEQRQKSYFVPRLNELSDDTREALVTYLNNAVRAKRMEQVADKCANTIIYRLDTAADLLVTWPGLVPLLDKWDRKDRATMWRERFRNPPNYRKLPVLSHNLDMSEWRPMLEVADMVIIGANMMPVYHHQGGVVRAIVSSFELIPGDKDFSR